MQEQQTPETGPHGGGKSESSAARQPQTPAAAGHSGSDGRPLWIQLEMARHVVRLEAYLRPFAINTEPLLVWALRGVAYDRHELHKVASMLGCMRERMRRDDIRATQEREERAKNRQGNGSKEVL